MLKVIRNEKAAFLYLIALIWTLLGLIKWLEILVTSSISYLVLSASFEYSYTKKLGPIEKHLKFSPVLTQDKWGKIKRIKISVIVKLSIYREQNLKNVYLAISRSFEVKKPLIPGVRCAVLRRAHDSLYTLPYIKDIKSSGNRRSDWLRLIDYFIK